MKGLRMPAVAFLVLLSAGNVLAQWIEDGSPICVANGIQEQPRIVGDGLGGAIVVWVDSRSGNRDVYAQRIDTNGNLLWAPNGIAVCTAILDQRNLAVVSDGRGGAIITWQDIRFGRSLIYAQRLNAEGIPLWQADGLAAGPTYSGTQQWPVLVCDGGGGAIVAWHDSRSGATGIYAQRINEAGMPQWTGTGVPIWIKPYVILGDEWPSIASDGTGGAIVAWHDYRSGTNFDVYAQRVTGTGAVVWANNGVPVCITAPWQHGPRLAPDGAGGAVIAWTEDYNIRAQRIDGTGSIQWMAEGVPVCVAYGNQDGAEVMSSETGGTIVGWWNIAGSLGVQKLQMDGAVLWPDNGITVPLGYSGLTVPVSLASDLAGGAIVAGGANQWLLAERISADGQRSWMPGVTVSAALGYHSEVKTVSDGSGGVIITWRDKRTDDGDIYAHRVTNQGEFPVATLLQHYSAAFTGSSIAIEWMLSEADEEVEFFIARATQFDGPFMELPVLDLAQNGVVFTYLDNACEPGKSYWYRVEYSSGVERRLLFETGPVAIPAVAFALHQNRPNPFNPTTRIRFDLPVSADVRLAIYDVSGRKIRELASGTMAAGAREVTWDGRDSSGRAAASGIYFYRLDAGRFTQTRKMILLR